MKILAGRPSGCKMVTLTNAAIAPEADMLWTFQTNGVGLLLVNRQGISPLTLMQASGDDAVATRARASEDNAHVEAVDAAAAIVVLCQQATGAVFNDQIRIELSVLSSRR